MSNEIKYAKLTFLCRTSTEYYARDSASITVLEKEVSELVGLWRHQLSHPQKLHLAFAACEQLASLLILLQRRAVLNFHPYYIRKPIQSNLVIMKWVVMN